MKTKLFFLCLVFTLFLTNFLIGQTWVSTEIGTPSISSINFRNSNVGYAAALDNTVLKVYKTNNKGVSWTATTNIGTSYYQATSIASPSPNKILVYNNNKIHKSTNDGQSWSETQIGTNTSSSIIIKFKDANTGFYAYTNSNFTDGVRIYRTIDGGETWTEVKHYPEPGHTTTYTYIIKDFGFSIVNSSQIVLTGYRISFSGVLVTSITALSNDNGQNWSDITPGAASSTLDDPYTFIDYVDLGNQTNNYRLLKGISENENPDNGVWCIMDNNGSVSQSKIVGGNFFVSDVGGIKFLNYYTGFALIKNKLYKTTNSGVNWAEDLTLDNNHSGNNNGLFSFGDVAYTYNGNDLKIRTIPTSLITNFDGSSGNGALAFDGSNYGTPSNQELRGGYSEIYANPILQNSSLSNTDAIFYKWSNGYMPHIRANEEYLYPGSFTADYKTKKYSTTSNSISNVTQRRAFRDINGNVNTVHESMGGIFFTKSTNNGATFITEEIVSDRSGGDQWATNNNANSFINEVYRPTVMVTPYSTEKTPVVIWEQRSGNTITINTANRWKSSNGQYYWW